MEKILCLITTIIWIILGISSLGIMENKIQKAICTILVITIIFLNLCCYRNYTEIKRLTNLCESKQDVIDGFYLEGWGK